MCSTNSKLKPLILNTYDNHGGAAIATYRIHRGLRSIGINSTMLVQSKKTDAPSVIGSKTKWNKTATILRPMLDELPTKVYRQREKVFFSAAWLPERLASKVMRHHPDIVHLFWVGNGFLKIETLQKFKQPIVWTLHDMWPFTGGCHYDNGCGKFRHSCGSCPTLHSSKEDDLSHRVMMRKQRSLKGVPIVVVATSRWMADLARESTLFKHKRIEVIPNGLDTKHYKPINKKAARTAFNFPQDKHLILFSAFSATSDERKGGQFLLKALEKLSGNNWQDKAELVIIGASRPQQNQTDSGMKVHYMGYLHDEISQVLLYSAADVVVAPSMQENLSNTVLEALACGTPVVAFNVGGMPDMIDHQVNGYLAIPFRSNDLADGIIWVLESKDRYEKLSQHACQTIEERFALQRIANTYFNLYEDILN